MAKILLLSSDLNARARLEAALPPEAGVTAVPRNRLTAAQGYDLAVIDLDETGADVTEVLQSAGFEGRMIGFFSHVNEGLGAAARAAGIETHPRGRFWQSLASILGY